MAASDRILRCYWTVKLLVELIVFFIVGTLQIERVEEEDEGKYECSAQNSVGVAYSYSANLYVRGKTDIKQIYT